MTENTLQRLVMERELHTALEEAQFELFFQPRCTMDGQHLLGAEVLIRWQHPQQGLLAPGQFLPHAEKLGLIVDIDRQAYNKAIRCLSAWYSKGLVPENFVLSLNLSILQLQKADFASFMQALLASRPIRASMLELEVTETRFMENMSTLKQQLHALEAMGLRLALDDFGTGYSSLAYLKRLRFDTLKIDRSFVMEIEHEEDRSIIRAILGMARALGLSVVAEGVETESQRQILLNEGCHQAQGFLFHKPMPENEFLSLLQRAHQAEPVT